MFLSPGPRPPRAAASLTGSLEVPQVGVSRLAQWAGGGCPDVGSSGGEGQAVVHTPCVKSPEAEARTTQHQLKGPPGSRGNTAGRGSDRGGAPHGGPRAGLICGLRNLHACKAASCSLSSQLLPPGGLQMGETPL